MESQIRRQSGRWGKSSAYYETHLAENEATLDELQIERDELQIELEQLIQLEMRLSTLHQLLSAATP